MLQNKLVYVVGTKLFYNIRVFENFDSAMSALRSVLQLKLVVVSI